MSQEQREALETMPRDGPLDLGGDVPQQRTIFTEMMQATPIPGDVTATPGTLGGVPIVNI